MIVLIWLLNWQGVSSVKPLKILQRYLHISEMQKLVLQQFDTKSDGLFIPNYSCYQIFIIEYLLNKWGSLGIKNVW